MKKGVRMSTNCSEQLTKVDIIIRVKKFLVDPVTGERTLVESLIQQDKREEEEDVYESSQRSS